MKTTTYIAYLIAFTLGFLFLPTTSPARKTFGQKIICCGGNNLQIIQTPQGKNAQEKILWEWNINEGAPYWPQEFKPKMYPLDECKPVDKGRKLLVTSSGGGVILLDIATRKCLFYANVPMAHSADLLPGGYIAVALSVDPKGNSIELYDMKKSDQRLYRDSLFAGHGSVWMSKQNLLYALGNDQIRTYRLVTPKGEPARLEQTGMWKLPSSGGHDLNKISDTELLVTNSRAVYVFNTETHQFTDFEPLKKQKNIKSVNFSKKTGQTIYTKAEISWWTHHIYSKQPNWTLTRDSINLYKVRVFE